MTMENDLTQLHAEIDANLRKAYQQTLNEELPKRFLDLIDQLKMQDECASGGPPEQGAEK